MANEMTIKLADSIKKAKSNMQGREFSCELERNFFFAEQLIADGVIVPPCKVGDAVYFVCEGDEEYFISENKVNDVSSKGFFVSCHEPPQDDLGDFDLYEVIGKDAFFTKEEAEKALKERCNNVEIE